MHKDDKDTHAGTNAPTHADRIALACTQMRTNAHAKGRTSTCQACIRTCTFISLSCGEELTNKLTVPSCTRGIGIGGERYRNRCAGESLRGRQANTFHTAKHTPKHEHGLERTRRYLPTIQRGVQIQSHHPIFHKPFRWR